MSGNGVQVLTHRVPSKMADELRAVAAREGTSLNYEMTVALRAHLDADKKRRGK